jgi:6,7-dimethyl-8-ribityllumazine synthase
MAEAISTISGDLVVRKEERFAIIVSRFNDFITSRLLDSAVDTLKRHGAAAEGITTIWVPGSWELPMVAKRAAATGQFDAVICLGCVIRGDTPHFEYVSAEAAKGVAQVGLQVDMPIVFGVLTTDTLDQAVNRAGAKSGNKGSQAALTAIEMANLYTKLKSI